MNATATKAKGIIFSAPMVRAILAGRKTQTRRPMKPQPPEDAGTIYAGLFYPTKIARDGEEYPGQEVFGAFDVGGEWGVKARYAPGDLLYVKEAYCVGYELDPGSFTCLPYKGCEDDRQAFYRATDDDKPDEPRRPWKSPIYMPRWASRITLEITDVRVQRVQEITEADVEAEGAFGVRDNLWGWENWDGGCWETPQLAYRHLWEQIHGEGAWAANLWCWAISFKAVK